MSKNKEKDSGLRFRSNCEVALTESELKTCAKALAEALNTVAQIQSELAAFKAQKKAQAAEVESVIRRNTLLLNTGKEFRMVECAWHMDWKLGKKTGVRLDTGEVVLRDTISDEERQMHLDEPEVKQ